ncbi:hypothetical protein Mapa_012717 [Marchantia paleacea]|nr:hypothetical protein Mapa_012717 [Marchantia paleacea]
MWYFDTKFEADCVSVCRIYRNHGSGLSKGVGNVLFKDVHVAREAVRLSEAGLLELYDRKLDLKFLAERNRTTHKADSRLKLQDCVIHIGSMKAEENMVSYAQFQSPLDLEVDKERQTVSLYFSSRKKQNQFKMEFRAHDSFRLRVLHDDRSHNKELRGFLIQIKQIPPYLFYRRKESDVTGDKYAEMLSQVLVTKKDSNCDLDSSDWSRTTDFTGKFLIGQAFAYMVDINGLDKRQEARLIEILNLRENLEHERTFLVERGIPYAISQEVVPIIRSEKLQKYPIHLDLTFKLNYLIQHGKLNATTFDEECVKLVIRGSEGHVRTALQTISQLPPEHDVLNSRTLLMSALEQAKLQFPNPPDLTPPGQGRAWIYRLLITPTKAYCMEPEVESSNRVIRLYEKHAENFLRVNFVDEDLCPLNGTSLVSALNTSYSPLYRRIQKVLKEGFTIGNKRYEFLAFSASQLRDGQLWMFAEVMLNGKPQITADILRADMGDFSQIRNVAKCAARMGQCFSSSRKTLTVLPLQLKKIQDIFVTTGDVKYCFSDGIGKISVDFARKVAATCGCEPGKVPSAFQIRYGGYKGVVAIDPSASNSFNLYLRPSMRKFGSAHFGLEVLEWTHLLPCYLNRQAISLLSTLGVKDKVFMDLQDQMVLKWCKAVNDETLATKLLLETVSNSMALKLLNCGFTFECEPLLRRLMLAYMHAQLNDIRTRARIFVPEGRMLMGCLDETGILEYGQAFVKISSNAEEMKSNTVSTVRVIQGEIIVLKNPCLHPGDVRVLQCVNVPQLQHMVDCIVFPRRGPRPHPNECSGSDLDGDMYLVSWNHSLLPTEVEAPMNYESPAAVVLNRGVTIEVLVLSKLFPLLHRLYTRKSPRNSPE